MASVFELRQKYRALKEVQLNGQAASPAWNNPKVDVGQDSKATEALQSSSATELHQQFLIDVAAGAGLALDPLYFEALRDIHRGRAVNMSSSNALAKGGRVEEQQIQRNHASLAR